MGRRKRVLSMALAVSAGVAGLAAIPPAAHGDQAILASSFINSIGVNTHFADSDGGGYLDNDNALLINLGVQHIRDGLVVNYANNHSSGYYQELQTLANNGIHADLISDPRGDLGTQTPTSSLNGIISLNATTTIVESIEGPNELDTDGNYTYDGNSGFPSNVIAYQQQLYSDFKGNSKTANLTVIGPSEGETYGSASQNPLAAGSLYNYCDAGNFHPYSFGGNFDAQHYTYDTIYWYYGQANTPSINIGTQFAYSFPVYQPPFALYNSSGNMTAARPMYATEKGYYTGTAAQSVSQATFAKYIPRMFADDLVAGIARTYSYQLVDQTTDPSQGFANGGLIAINGNGTLSPKPAYYTLQHMIQLLSDTGNASTTSSLNYTISYNPPAGYTTASPNYWGIPPTIQHLLLQKSNGTFALLLWNDVSSAAIADTSGNALGGTARDIAVPAFPVTLTFTTPVQSSVTLYGLDPYGTTFATTLDTSQLSIVNDQITLNVPDYVTILQIQAVPEPASVALVAFGVVALLLGRQGCRKGGRSTLVVPALTAAAPPMVAWK